ncbi:MAG TPA: HAD family phosphatase [Bryobacteraceae bacterium]|nr:HAD family phosphatase [Bryobacteraceae bacterium]
MMRIRPAAVIFDYGNVLSAPQGSSEIASMASILKTGVDPFREAYWRFRISYDQAALAPEDYWAAVATTLATSLTTTQIATLIEIDSQSWSYPARDLPGWARNLHREGMKTAVLSNIPIPVRDYIERCDWLPPFHQRTFSCDTRIAKPAPEIYRHCIDGLGVDPAEILFLDDRPENVRAAETLGLHGILYQSAEQAAAELRQRFDMPVPLVATLEDGDEKNE